jgi:hypothetical protein
MGSSISSPEVADRIAARDEHYGNNSLCVWLEACHAVDVVQEAFNRQGKPEIVNTDQGSQFTA